MSSRVNNDSYHHHFSTNQLSSLFGNFTAEISVEKRPPTGDPFMAISYGSYAILTLATLWIVKSRNRTQDSSLRNSQSGTMSHIVCVTCGNQAIKPSLVKT